VEFNSKFQAIQAANEILTDPQQRAKYDADRLKAGYGAIYSSPMRPPPPPRQSTAKYPPPPRPQPPANKSTYPKPTPASKPNPSYGPNRYTKFAQSEAEAKQARTAAEQWEKAKEDAETKAGAFRGWEQMKSSVNTQNFRAPPRPKPREYTGFARSTTNETPNQKPSWEQFPGAQTLFPGVARAGSTRKKQGFAPNTLGGDEPMARNTSAYFNVSRGDRPQTSMPQSYFEAPTSGQAPAARKAVSPLRHARSHGGVDDPLSGLGVERPDGRYAQAGVGEKYFTTQGLGRDSNLRDPLKQQTPAAGDMNSPKPRDNSGRHHSASPRLRRPISSSSSSSESTDDDTWAARPNTAAHRMPKESINSDTRSRQAVRDFGEAKAFFDGSGRYGPRDWQQETEASQTHPNIPTTQGNTNGTNTQYQNFGIQTEYPPPPPYPPPRDGTRQRPLEKSRSWHDPNSPTRVSNDGTTGEPSSAQSMNSPNMYGSSAHPQYPFSYPSSFTPKWSEQWPFSSKKESKASTAPLPYWAYPSSVMPPSNASRQSPRSTSSSKRKASLDPQVPKKHPALGQSVSFSFDTSGPPTYTSSVSSTDAHDPFRFKVPSGGSGFSRSPPADFRSYSSENLNTAFNPADWDRTFSSDNAFFVPKPSDANRGSRAGSSPTRGRQTGRTSFQTPSKPPGLYGDNSAADEAQAPQAGAQSSYAPFSPAKFSSEEWAERLKYTASADPAPNSTQQAANRSKTPRRQSRSSVKRSSVSKTATVSADIENRQGNAENFATTSNDTFDGGPMDIDDPRDVLSAGQAPSTSNGINGESFPDKAPSKADVRRSSHLSQSKATNAAAAPPLQDARLNLSKLNHVAPLAPSNEGLEGISDLKTGLPFKSQASASVARPEAKLLVIPNPPKGPVPPENITFNTFEIYIAEMGAYMYEWNQYNEKMLQHFNARQTDIETNLSSTWMSSVGDGSAAKGKKGYADYMQALEDDAQIRIHWDVSWEKHQGTMKSLGKIREKMKVLLGGNGTTSA
jgi:curved DNA-binding protein CbpA